jgi:hypothetical protein
MNEQQRAVVQQAIDAFAVLKMNDYSGYECTKHETDKIDDAETALRQLLEQPEQEPVGKWTGKCIEWTENPYKFKKGQSIYTTPPAQPAAWVGLTADEMLEALVSVDPATKRLPIGFARFAQAIEAKLKEKNGGAACG